MKRLFRPSRKELLTFLVVDAVLLYIVLFYIEITCALTMPPTCYPLVSGLDQLPAFLMSGGIVYVLFLSAVVYLLVQGGSYVISRVVRKKE